MLRLRVVVRVVRVVRVLVVRVWGAWDQWMQMGLGWWNPGRPHFGESSGERRWVPAWQRLGLEQEELYT